MTLERFLKDFSDDKKLIINLNGNVMRFKELKGNEIVENEWVVPHLQKPIKHLFSSKTELSIIVGGWD